MAPQTYIAWFLWNEIRIGLFFCIRHGILYEIRLRKKYISYKLHTWVFLPEFGKLFKFYNKNYLETNFKCDRSVYVRYYEEITLFVKKKCVKARKKTAEKILLKCCIQAKRLM